MNYKKNCKQSSNQRKASLMDIHRKKHIEKELSQPIVPFAKVPPNIINNFQDPPSILNSLHTKFGNELPIFDNDFITKFLQYFNEQVNSNSFDEPLQFLDHLIPHNAKSLISFGIFKTLIKYIPNSFEQFLKLIYFSGCLGSKTFLDEGALYFLIFFSDVPQYLNIVVNIFLEITNSFNDDFYDYTTTSVIPPIESAEDSKDVEFNDFIENVFASDDQEIIIKFLTGLRKVYKKSTPMCTQYSRPIIDRISLILSMNDLSIAIAKTISVVIKKTSLINLNDIFPIIHCSFSSECEKVIISGIRLSAKLAELEKYDDEESIIYHMENENIVQAIFKMTETGTFRIKEEAYWAIASFCEYCPIQGFFHLLRYNLINMLLCFFADEAKEAYNEYLRPIMKITFYTLDKSGPNLNFFQENDNIQEMEELRLQVLETFDYLQTSEDKEIAKYAQIILEPLEHMYPVEFIQEI